LNDWADKQSEKYSDKSKEPELWPWKPHACRLFDSDTWCTHPGSLLLHEYDCGADGFIDYTCEDPTQPGQLGRKFGAIRSDVLPGRKRGCDSTWGTSEQCRVRQAESSAYALCSPDGREPYCSERWSCDQEKNPNCELDRSETLGVGSYGCASGIRGKDLYEGDGDWGAWQRCWERCPPGRHVVAAKVMTGFGEGGSDDRVGVSAVQMKCSDGTTIGHENFALENRKQNWYDPSTVPPSGHWGGWQSCSKEAKAANPPQLRGFREYRKLTSYGDQMAVTSIDFLCNRDDPLERWDSLWDPEYKKQFGFNRDLKRWQAIESDGWWRDLRPDCPNDECEHHSPHLLNPRDIVACPEGQRVIGFKMKWESWCGFKSFLTHKDCDDTALNGLALLCSAGWKDSQRWKNSNDTWVEVPSKLVKRGVECNSTDIFLGTFEDVDSCAATCATAASCKFFIFGTSSKQGRCYQEKTASEACPEGWEVDSYDFYTLRSCGGRDSYCTNIALGDGDCDDDSDCANGGRCGTDNCIGDQYDPDDDCCSYE